MRTEVLNREQKLRGVAMFLIGTGVIRRGKDQKLLPDYGPVYLRPTNGKFYDVNQNDPDEIAGAFLEEGTTREVKKRINLADEMGTKNGVPQVEFSRFNKYAEVEREATMSAFRLAQNNNLIFWISPDDGGEVYKEGRLNIYLARKDGKEVYLKGRGIPLLIDRFKSVDLAKRLVEAGGVIEGELNGVDDVRKKAIAFKIDDTGKWVNKCRELMPEFAEFWEFLEEGGEIKYKQQVEKVVREVMAVARGNNYKFESEMARKGFLINAIGGHGSSWNGNEMSRVYGFDIKMVRGEPTAEIQKVNGRFICPVCGEEVGEGATSCRVCGVKLK